MAQICCVETLDLPELAVYRTLRRPLEHWKQGIFVAEGGRVVARLLGSGLTVESMLLTPEWYHRLSEAIAAKPWGDSLRVFLAERTLMEGIVGFPLHQGAMAVARVPKEPSLAQMVAAAARPLLLVALDGIVSAENVGVIVRNCCAFGAGGVLVSRTSGSPYLRRAVRNSMGAVFRIPVMHTSDLAGSLDELQRLHGVVAVAAQPGARLEIHDVALSGDLCLVLGSEGEGISQPVLEACARKVSIPMLNGADSLNVGSASAVFLYEMRKQRR